MDSYLENKERHVLIVNTGGRRAYALEAAAYSVGRDSTNAIVLDFDTVSRQHALLLRVPNPNTKRYEYRIIDGNAEGKASANGLYINGDAVKSQTLKNGDSVEFGQHVKAAYLTLSMGEAEFVNYLESISYQSLKSELVDNRATMVGGLGFDAMFSDAPTKSSSSGTKETRPSTSQRKVAKWQETLHDSDETVKAIPNIHSSVRQEKSPLRLWMLIAGGIFAVAIAGGGLLVVKQSQPQQSAPATSSVSTP